MREVLPNGTLSADERVRTLRYGDASAIKNALNGFYLLADLCSFFRRSFIMSGVTKANKILFSGFFLRMSNGGKIACLGVFIALSIVVNMFSIDITPSIKVSFNYLVAFFAGTFFGPVAGFLVCFLGDILAFVIFPSSGVYWFLTGINTGLLAFIPGLVMNLLPLNVYIKAAISVALMYLLCTCGFGAYSNYLYVKTIVYHGSYDKAFFAYLGGKIAVASIVSAINYVLVFILIPVINSIKALHIRIK